MLLSILFAFCLLTAAIPGQAGYDVKDIAPSLVMNQGWVPYPAYTDRDGWSEILGEYQAPMIRQGEAQLDFQWVTITSDDYMAYELTGDRAVMEDKQEANTDALSRLVIAELADGQGRFIPDIARGVKWFCDAPAWAVSAHLAKYQKSKSPLPDPSDPILALYQGNISQLLSWTYYYFHEQLEQVQPGLAARLRSELQRRELDLFLQRDDFWWMGFKPVPGKVLNNWNPWCNANAMLCFMLLENDRDTLAAAISKAVRSLNLYLESVTADGACDEGTTYWYKSTGHVMDCLECLEMITSGDISLWSDPLICKLGDYIVNADVGDNWQVNFADGKPSRNPLTYMIYRYGLNSGNKAMMDFAVNRSKVFLHDPVSVLDWTLFYQSMENLRAIRTLKQQPDAEYKSCSFVFYPNAEVAFIRSGKSFLAAKGGNNLERHNHNDVGSCIYFYDCEPVLIDAGVGTYTRDTFGSGRFRNWFVQSGWHNLPVVNGCEQEFGADYKASGSKASKCLRRFTTDIAGTYPDSAGVKSWRISYRLDRKGGLTIKHKYSLKDAGKPNELHFLLAEEPDIREGRASLPCGVSLVFDPQIFTASVEKKCLKGLGFSSRWGDALYRLCLTDRQTRKKGTYTIKLVSQASETIEEISAKVSKRAGEQFTLLSERLAGDMTPRTILPDGSMKDCAVGSWTSGFFAGSLWQLYSLGGGSEVLELARKETAKLAPVLDFPISHDIGFQINCSYGNAYRITGEEQYLPLIKEAAAALAGRFNPVVGATLSWTAGEKGEYPVIIDNMMNLELLEYACKLFGCDSLNEIAVKHAETTLRNHFRPDASSWHMLDYDPQTGEVLRRVTVQGYSDDSTWARGQAWALYGFSMMYRETGRVEFLEQAEAIAGMLLTRLPYDGIPYWDFDDPSIPTYKDASAGAIMCSAFIELSGQTKDKKLADSCLRMAERQIRTLAGPEYLATVGTNGNFLLKHSVGNLPGGSEIDVPLPYADYYFLEALNRIKTQK